MERIYLDTNILIPLIVEDKSLEKRRQEAILALEVLSAASVEFCVSSWTLTEMVKVMINDYSMQPKRVAVLHNAIGTSKSLGGFKITIIPVSPKKGYSVDDLLLEVREIMTNYNPGWGDAIHCVVMRQNEIKQILSADAKNDFKIIPGLTLLHPKNISLKPTLIIDVAN
jgi:predicted nucleic acid-binding protein